MRKRTNFSLTTFLNSKCIVGIAIVANISETNDRQPTIHYGLSHNVARLAAVLLLVKCYDRKKVKSLVDLTIINVV